ncbi:MAG TPA: ABC transporter permease, partial [Candidatus Limnocylindria bacterium]|nr:ABC transporter permease [Candidatus Limnocylindria bacterium]
MEPAREAAHGAQGPDRAATTPVSTVLAAYRSNERLILGLVGIVGFFVLWQVAADLGWISTLFFSSPIAVFHAGVAEVQKASFWNDVQLSAFEFLVGYVLAAAVAVPLGLAIGWYATLNDFVSPWLNFFYALPRIALAPVILLWLGIGIQSIIAIVFLGAFFSVILNTVHGARIVDPRLVKVTRSFGASEWRTFLTLVVPSSIPLILVGLRLGVARAITGVVIGELFASNAGLGHLIVFASNALDIDRVLFAVFFLVVIGVVSVEALRRLDVRFAT